MAGCGIFVGRLCAHFSVTADNFLATTAEDVIAVCRRELPTYMVPALVELRVALPRNPNGKIDRPAVAAQFSEQFESLQS